MTIEDLHAILERLILEERGHCRIEIQAQIAGRLSSNPYMEIKDVRMGFDWTANTCVIQPKETLLDLKSVQKLLGRET